MGLGPSNKESFHERFLRWKVSLCHKTKKSRKNVAIQSFGLISQGIFPKKNGRHPEMAAAVIGWVVPLTALPSLSGG